MSLTIVLRHTPERLQNHPHDALAVYPSRSPDAAMVESHWRLMSREGARMSHRVDLGTLRGHAAARALMHALGWATPSPLP